MTSRARFQPVAARWRRAAGLGGLLISLSLVVAPAQADLWYQHYEKAKEALKRGEAEEAVLELNQAIERRGDSGARVRTYGMRTEDYFPYLKLGIAYFQLGQLEAALQAFETEERLGAIEASERGADELRTYRSRVEDALASRAEEESQRAQQILGDSLRQAQELLAGDQIDEAMKALGRGLAVAPDDAQANALMELLRAEAQRRQRLREVDQKVTNLVEQGQRLLDQGAFSEAASRFRQALNLKVGDPLVEELLDRSQRLLREEIREREQAADQTAFVGQALTRVAELEGQGQLDEALEKIQAVIAIDPLNSEAQAVEARLIEARQLLEQESSRLQSVELEVATADRHFEAGRFEDALSAANRALATDPGNASALAMVAKAYGEINRILLGRSAGGNIPPAIRFADFRVEQEEGVWVQRVREPRFRLSGMVIDNSPVEIRFTDEKKSELSGEIRRQQLGDFYLTEFQLDTDLGPGAATFRLTATDAENLSSSSEYSVEYARPWFRSPGLLLTAGLLIVAIAGGGLAERLRRRARRRRRRYNPYVAGAPVLDDELFYGREKLIDRILQTIHNNSLLLYGVRRIGKTSIQHHLKKRLQQLNDPVYEFFPVYVDLQGTPEERFFATIAEDVFQQLGPHLEGLKLEGAIEEDLPYTYRDLVRDLRKVVRRLGEASSKRVKLVLLIDEVDELNDYDPRINQRLRSLFMKSFAENLVAVVSGVEIKKQWERVGSPWYNFFEEIRVLPLGEEEARKLIERPISGVLKLGEGVTDRIIELTGRHPYLIQKACIALVNRVYEQGDSVITLAHVEALDRSEAA